MKSIFKDKDGNVVIGQRPNLPIIVWAITFLLGQFSFGSTIDRSIDLIGFGALFTWGWLELFDGVNTWRRILGGLVLLLLLSLHL